MTRRLGLAALLVAAACELEPATAPRAPLAAAPPSLQQLATTAGLVGATLSAAPCAGGLVGTRVEATGPFGAAHAFESALDRLPEPRHLAAGTLAREPAGPLRVSLQSCPGRGLGTSWLARLADATPERLRIDALEWSPAGATVEGVADERAGIDAFAAALRADPALAEVTLPAVGADGPGASRLAFVLVATPR